MRGITRLAGLAGVVLWALSVPNQAGAQSTAEALAAEIETLKGEYAARLEALEKQLAALKAKSDAPAPHREPASDNAFNPAIGVALNGLFARFSSETSEIPGFPTGHESERAPEGLSLGHSEITVSGNIDDKFRGNLTLGLGAHPGEPTELELEEAYVQTLPGAGLADGMRIKAGRALWTFGYLNELHAHADDFADRPLPYRAFLDNAFNDDGVEVSFVLPTALYSEIGGGLFRGDDMPFGGSDNGLRARSVYARVGGDLGRDAAWRIGAYMLDGESHGRGGGAHGHGHEESHAEEEEHHDEHEDEHALEEHEDEHEDEHGDEHAAFFSEGAFTGDTRLYGIDFRVTVSPGGDARQSELILQGEYFWRKEDGTYALAEEAEEGEEPHMEALSTDSLAHGWYLQAVYKLSPHWRIGARYARLSPPGDAETGHEPYAYGAMVDWTNSEFGRIRLQYNHEALDGHEADNQFMVQYVMTLGAHAAHSF